MDLSTTQIMRGKYLKKGILHGERDLELGPEAHMRTSWLWMHRESKNYCFVVVQNVFE